MEDAIEDGFAVFGFANLQEGGFRGGLDEVPLGINAEQLRVFSLDLAANEDITLKVDFIPFKPGAINLLDVPQGAADIAGYIVEAGEGVEVTVFVLFDILPQVVHHRLGDGKIATGTEDNGAIARNAEVKEFLIGRNIINSGIGAGVGAKNKSVAVDNS